VELANEIGDGLRVDPLYGRVAEAGEKPAERDVVGLQRSRRDVDAGSLPALRQLPQRNGGRFLGVSKIGNPPCGELASKPALPLVRFAAGSEGAPVEARRFAAAEPVDDSVAHCARRELDAANPGASHGSR